MGVLRIPQSVYEPTSRHLLAGRGEHFAFFHARVDDVGEEVVFAVHDVTLVPDDRVRRGRHGYDVDPDYLLEVVNRAVRGGHALVEAHNHRGALPRFSDLDRAQLREFVPYVLDSLGGRPYAATVWGDETIYGRYYRAGYADRKLRSICVVGNRMQQLVSREDDKAAVSTRFDRQLLWFTAAGQRQLGRLRAGVVGAGGTGSPLLRELAYLGLRQFVLIDPDTADDTSMNRLTTANAADVGTPKVMLGRRAILSIAPDSRIAEMQADVRTNHSLEALKGVDVIFGCVDNDGARLVLNELAVAYGIPYFDVGVGIEAHGHAVSDVGGRLAVVIPEGPCLLCMGTLDLKEAAYILSTPDQQRTHRERGYIRGFELHAPAVVSLNATVASLAVTEFAIYLSGLRRLNPLTVLDALGVGRAAGQWIVPERVNRQEGCVHCALAGAGDLSDIDRYRIARGPTAQVA